MVSVFSRSAVVKHFDNELLLVKQNVNIQGLCVHHMYACVYKNYVYLCINVTNVYKKITHKTKTI